MDGYSRGMLEQELAGILINNRDDVKDCTFEAILDLVEEWIDTNA